MTEPVDLTRAQSRRCKACDRPLYFVRNEHGKIVPLDAVAPTYRIDLDANGEFIAIRGARTYVTHFATCPSASAFSGGKKAADGAP